MLLRACMLGVDPGSIAVLEEMRRRHPELRDGRIYAHFKRILRASQDTSDLGDAEVAQLLDYAAEATRLLDGARVGLRAMSATRDSERAEGSAR